MSGRHIIVEGEVRSVTAKAVLFIPRGPDGDDGYVWVPRSVIVDGDHAEVGDTDLEVASWFVEREGL